MISAHSITATSGTTALDVSAARVTLDLGWAPYVQAEITCALPAPDVLARLDPRTPTRVRLSVSQRFTGSTSVARLSEAWSSPQYDLFEMVQELHGWVAANPQVIIQANEYGLHLVGNSQVEGTRYTATKTFATIPGEQYVVRANVHAVGYRPDTSAGVWTSADGLDVTAPLPPIPANTLFYEAPAITIEHPFTAISTQTEIQVWGQRDVEEDWYGGELGMEWFVLQFDRRPDFSPVPVTNIVTNTSFEANVTGWTGTTATGAATLARVAGGVVGSWAARLTWSAAPTAPSGSLAHTFELGGGGNDYVYSASVWVRSSKAQTVALRLTSVSTPTGGSIDLVTAQGPLVALAAGVWTELRYDAFDPAPPIGPPYAFKIRLAVEVDPATGIKYAVSDYLEADAAIVTRSRSAPDFFDGDTPDDLGDRYTWTDAYRASPSVHDFPTYAPISGVSTHYAGKTIAAISADFAMPWNPGPTRPNITRTFDLGVRTRTADVGAGELRLSLASDEALLQDFALMAKTLINVGGTSLTAAVNYALAQIGATLADGLDAVVDPAALDWTPGTSGWDFCTPLVQGGARRLWCDGARKWHLTDPLQPTSGGLILETIQKTQTDTVDRDGNWADGVVVEYSWDDAAGLSHVAYDVAGSGSSTLVKTYRYERPMAALGAAAAILARSQDQGRGLQVSAVADYSAAPGLAVRLPVADGTTVVGMLEAVSFAFPDDEMTVSVQDVSRAAPNSWASIPAGIPWSAIPVGMTWPAINFPQGG